MPDNLAIIIILTDELNREDNVCWRSLKKKGDVLICLDSQLQQQLK